MNANAIVYTSNTGYTAQYAGLLGKRPACRCIPWLKPGRSCLRETV